MSFSNLNPAKGKQFAAVASGLLAMAAPLANAAKPFEFEGEKFVVHTIVDQQQGGMPCLAFQTPERWKVDGRIQWKYENTMQPVTSYFVATNPDKPETVTAFGQVGCFWLTGAAAFNRPGTVSMGSFNLQPMSPADTLRSAIVKLFRPNVPNLQVIGSRELPNLAASIKMDPKQFRGVGIKVQYTENGQPFDEEFYALYYYGEVPYDGPQGHSVQINWGLLSAHSFKAPRDTLEKRRPIFAYMIHSVELNPQWKERSAAVQQMINDQFNRNLAQGYAAIEAAGQLSRQISANNDAMIASMDRQRAASNRAAPSAGAGRSANDRFDDYIRGVDTMNDPLTGTSQHSSSEQYHWTDGYGNYAHSNDASFNPNTTSSISWQQMTPAR